MTKSKRNDLVFNILLYIFMTFMAVITLYPFLNVFAISFNDAQDAVKGGITIWPRKFTLANYSQFVQSQSLITGFINSVIRTVLGTIIAVLCSAMLAFTFSRERFLARKLYSAIFLFTMYVGGGLIPTYMLYRDLGLLGHFAVYILPSIVGIFNVLIIKSFMMGLPYSLQESAMIDGANDFIIFSKIILPLCLPVLATVALFAAVGHWNSWFDTFLYSNDKDSLTTLQYELQKVLQSANSAVPRGNEDALKLLQSNRVTPEAIKMSITVIATVPILLVYPFVQKYFVQGMTLGAVKN